MRLRALIVLAALAGCAGTRLAEERVARLPPAERAALVDGQHRVALAQASVDAARVAVQEAESFRSVVASEAKAAGDRVEAARKAIRLGRESGEARVLAGASQEEILAEEALSAADAKVRYADELVGFRRAQAAQRAAELDLARARLAHDRANRLARHGLGDDLPRQSLALAAIDAELAVADRQAEVDLRRAAMLTSRDAWVERHRHFDLAARDRGIAPIDAPGPPPSVD